VPAAGSSDKVFSLYLRKGNASIRRTLLYIDCTPRPQLFSVVALLAMLFLFC
jgi:hypothetical protein